MAFSEEDLEARTLVRQWMEEAGMEVRIDPAGNMIGRYEGLNPEMPVLATGSHIDTVPAGGVMTAPWGCWPGSRWCGYWRSRKNDCSIPSR